MSYHEFLAYLYDHEATRDLAVALVDATQHTARLSEALHTLLQPHDLVDHPEAQPLTGQGAKIEFEHVAFTAGQLRQLHACGATFFGAVFTRRRDRQRAA